MVTSCPPDYHGNVLDKYINDRDNNTSSIVLDIGTAGKSISYPILIDPLATDAFWSYNGQSADTAFGHAVAVGDFNNDT